jgi:hypothetical protein
VYSRRPQTKKKSPLKCINFHLIAFLLHLSFYIKYVIIKREGEERRGEEGSNPVGSKCVPREVINFQLTEFLQHLLLLSNSKYTHVYIKKQVKYFVVQVFRN